jgi:hypothetical protein
MQGGAAESLLSPATAKSQFAGSLRSRPIIRRKKNAQKNPAGRFLHLMLFDGLASAL